MNIIGKGGCAEVIEYGEGKVCKLFYKAQPEEFVKLEYENSVEIYKSGLTVPEVFEVIAADCRKGIVYERIYGKSLSDLLKEGKNKFDVLDIFVKSHCEILKHKSKNLLSYKEFLKAVVGMCGNYDNFIGLFRDNKVNDLSEYKKYINSMEVEGEEEKMLVKEIYNLPDGDCICHGDFHFNNILVKTDGQEVIIDFMNVCSGPFLYDVARTFYGLSKSEDFFRRAYLKKMNVKNNDIKEYLNVINKCRKYELLLNSIIEY